MPNLMESFGAGVARVLLPVINRRLDAVQADVKAEVGQFLDDARKDIPRIAKEVAQTAVQTVFDNTQIDEAADNALGVVNEFFGRFGMKLP